MKKAYHLINFGVWPDKSEDEKIQAVKDAGYEGIESITIDYTASPSVVKDRMDKFGLKLAAQTVPCLIMGTDDRRLTELAQGQISVAKSTDCKISVIMVARTDGDKTHSYGSTLDHYQEAGRRLNLIGRILADSGVALCIHNHIDHMAESVEEMDILMNETDERSVGICFDTAHAVCGGNDPLAYAKRFRSRIRHLHLKDTKNFLSGRPYFFKNAFLPLGEGVIDFPAIMAVLGKYNGWVTVELDASFSCGDPVKEAKISLAYLRSTFERKTMNTKKIESRVETLLKRMTLEEKIGQLSSIFKESILQNEGKDVPRLDIQKVKKIFRDEMGHLTTPFHDITNTAQR